MPIATHEAIAHTRTGFLSKFNQGDIHDAAQVFTPDARSFPLGFPQVDGPDAIANFWAGTTVKLGVTGVQLHTTALEEHGDTVFEEGHFVLSTRKGVLDKGKYLVVWKQQPDGTWKWHRDFWNSSKL
jgi:ketosteroid isomerase-like protein